MTEEQWQIEKIVAKILKTNFEEIRFPIDIKNLAKSLNIKIEYSDLKGEDGYIFKYKNSYMICIDDTDNFRNNFTLAHEVGHVVLGHLDTHEHLPYYVKERQANHFAGALLMPFHFMVAYKDELDPILNVFMNVSKKAEIVRRNILEADIRYKNACNRKIYKPDLKKDLALYKNII